MITAPPARADAELWLWSEIRLPVATAEELPFRTTFRVWNDYRFNRRSDGLHQIFLRAGPLVDLTPWLVVGVQGTVYADRLPTGDFEEERRVELEPTFHGRWGPMTFSDRNRVEYRWRKSGDSVRYRNQLRVNYAPQENILIPFVWNEVLVEISERGFNQNRLMAGLGIVTAPSTRIELGYMWRAREVVDTWFNDHIAVLYLFYNGWER